MNLTFNYTDLSVSTNPMLDQLNCSANLDTFLNSSSKSVNLYAIVFFFVYAFLLFVSQYLLEKKQISLKNYVVVHYWVNNVAVSLAIIYLIYGLLLA